MRTVAGDCACAGCADATIPPAIKRIAAERGRFTADVLDAYRDDEPRCAEHAPLALGEQTENLAAHVVGDALAQPQADEQFADTLKLVAGQVEDRGSFARGKVVLRRHRR